MASEFHKIGRSSEIAVSEVDALVANLDSLEAIPDRTGTNPFTGEDVLFPGRGKAYYIDDGEIVGNLSLENGEILATGVPKYVCEKIASLLGAKVTEWDAS